MSIFIPIKINNGDKPGIWQMDVTCLSTLELIKLRELLNETDFSPTRSALDNLIYNNMDEFRGTTNMYGNGFRKEQKRNKRIQENAKKKKVRRRYR